MILLVMVTSFLAMSVYLMLGPLLADLAEEFHTSVAVAGQLVALTLVAWGIVSPTAGSVSDTYGRRPVMLLGTSLAMAGVMASGFAWSYGAMVAFRLLTALGAAMIPSTVGATLSDIFPPHQRGRALGWMMAAGNLGALVGMPLTAVVADLAGWRWSFFMVGAMWGLVLIALLLWFPHLRLQRRESQKARRFFAGFGELARIRDPWVLLSSNMLHRMVGLGIVTYLAAYLMSTYDLSKTQVALPLALAGGGMVAGSLMGSDIAARGRRLLLVPVVMVAAALLGTVLFWSSPGAWVSAVLAASFTLIHYLALPTILAMTADIGGRSRATALGMFTASSQLAGVLGSSLGGVVLALGGFSNMGFLWLGAGLAAATVMRFGVRETQAFLEMKKQEQARAWKGRG